MHVFGLVLFGIIAFFWLTHGIRVAYGALRLPWLKDFSPAADADCPRISLIFAARDEEEKLPAALVTLMEIDYPNLEVIAVDDRSNDATRRILDDYAAAHPRLRVVHVTDLPPGWRSEEHTSELQSPCNLVCRLLLEKKKQKAHTRVPRTSSSVV